MARLRRRGAESALNAWPGYVDALSTLLMVIIFVLLVFVLAQAFLATALSNREAALEKINRQLAEMTEMLALERGQVRELQFSVARLGEDVRMTSAERDRLREDVRALTALRAELELKLRDAAARAITDADRHAGLAAQLAEDVRMTNAERDRLREEVRALTTLRAELELKLRDAAARAITDADRHAGLAAQLAEERNLTDSARAKIALLTRAVEELRAQLAAIARALELAQQSAHDKDTHIANLGAQLNAALAAKVEELQRYRSEFFGRLRDVLANRPGIQVVGDRFVFQSEVLFPVGSATLSAAGQDQVAALAATIREISAAIPANLPWILRVDGHADRQPLAPRGGYATNWELSAARAITVVKQLIAEGVPAAHLAATGFGDNQPIDATDTPEAYAKNRRIELRLTDR